MRASASMGQKTFLSWMGISVVAPATLMSIIKGNRCQTGKQTQEQQQATDDFHNADEWGHHIRRRNSDLGEASRQPIVEQTGIS